MDEAVRSAGMIAAARLVMLMSGLFMALVPMSAQSAESLQEKPTMTKQTIAVEYIRIESAKSFADVRAALERSVPHLDAGLVKALDNGDVERADREKEEGPELSIFQVRDHGALLKIAGKARNALQYDIGILSRPRLWSGINSRPRCILRSALCFTRTMRGSASSSTTSHRQRSDSLVTSE